MQHHDKLLLRGWLVVSVLGQLPHGGVPPRGREEDTRKASVKLHTKDRNLKAKSVVSTEAWEKVLLFEGEKEQALKVKKDETTLL